MPDWLLEFPQMERGAFRALSKAIDEGYRGFSRAYGAGIEDFFDPLLFVLVWIERLLLDAPWLLVLAVLGGLAWFAARSLKLTAGVLLAFIVIGYLGMWEDTMRTLAIICVCTIIAVIIGIPVGIAMARSDRTQGLITPILDVMQTLPIFVYLIPVVMLLGLGKVPGVIAVVIYAIPPVIRLTNLGLRLVDKDVLEAADAFGASPGQRLIGVQLPLAMPNIMAGVNQTIMMALSMVVIASMIGVKGLGQPVLKAVTNQYFALGLFSGAAVVALAIVFDRMSQGYGARLQKHRKA
ncbi:MAG: proline/glycine betaine ABC transporter permease [Rhodospirillales bacterium]|nr:ABC transporter permease [Rhodospirillaceae bacterium]MDP6426486.1 proline/glycine betaine ABC transporter permease [Rhodospirillales bacterium]MDP6643019.1 proline/glycine betaine ABC transporter permease [Rhodospirillales bacterium]MDP6842163.1 proline/glycine betaine ABC transporter permease [Rhodospirillales bacterium]